MRERLAPLEGQRRYFRASFKHYGGNPAGNRTLLLVGLTDEVTGIEVADHIWAKLTERLERRIATASVAPGDTIVFKAEVFRYERLNGDADYGIRHLVELSKWQW